MFQHKSRLFRTVEECDAFVTMNFQVADKLWYVASSVLPLLQFVFDIRSQKIRTFWTKKFIAVRLKLGRILPQISHFLLRKRLWTHYMCCHIKRTNTIFLAGVSHHTFCVFMMHIKHMVSLWNIREWEWSTERSFLIISFVSVICLTLYGFALEVFLLHKNS